MQALCRMRGAALKLGQMLSLSDDASIPAALTQVNMFVCVFIEKLLYILHFMCGLDIDYLLSIFLFYFI